MSTFSVISGASALLYGFAVRRFGANKPICFGYISNPGLHPYEQVQESGLGYLAAIFFGLGIEYGVLCVLPLSGRITMEELIFGAIRGVVLTVQVGAQAVGPILSGSSFWWTYNYDFVAINIFFYGDPISLYLSFYPSAQLLEAEHSGNRFFK